METFCSALLDRDLVSLEVLERALERQLLHGGDVGSNLLALGAIKEHAVLRLLADHHEMPAGPKGRLDAPGSEVRSLVPPEVMTRLGALPYKRTSRTLHVAAPGPLAPDVEHELRSLTGLQLRVAVAPAVRVEEGLAEVSGRALSSASEQILARLDEAAPVAPRASRGAAVYRRMSERADGVHVSRQQPGGLVFVPPSQPVPSDAPAPDSQGRWLDALVDARVALPQSESDEGMRGDDAARSAEVASTSGLPMGFADAVTLPPTVRGAAFPGDSEAPPSGASTDVPRSFVPTVPAPAQTSDSYALMPPTERTVRVAEAPARTERRFRHRGPLATDAALAYARSADEVELVLEVVARYARQYFERLVVFAVEGETAEARLSHGTGGPTPALLLDLSGDGLLASAVRTAAPLVGALTADEGDAALRRSLAAEDGDATVAAIPMSLRGQVIVLLYADDLGLSMDLDAVAAVEAVCEAAAEEMARIVLSAR